MHRHRIALAAAGLLWIATNGLTAAQAATGDLSGGASIVNGLTTTGYPSTGAVLFVGPDNTEQDVICSAVMIGCHYVLTSASCICRNTDNAADCEAGDLPDTSDLRIFFQHAGFSHVRQIYVNPDWERGKRADLALLNLSDKILGVQPTPINEFTPPDLDQNVTIVGFGNTGDGEPDAGKKRVGAAVTAECPATVLNPPNVCWNFEEPVGAPGTDSNTCEGDTGGPMFGDVGKGSVLLGIHSTQWPQCNADAVGIDTNVYRNRAWIDLITGDDSKQTQCKSTPRVGVDPEVLTQSIEDTMIAAVDEKVYEFDIPDNTEILRVGVNGFNERNGDYDIFVGLDRVPTKTDNDCEQRGKGKFGFCEFTNPTAKKVYVLIKHVMQDKGKGKSCFQIVITAIRFPLDCEVPEAPDKLEPIRRGEKRVRLQWRDNSNDEEGFLIQRKIGDQFNPFIDYAINEANDNRFLDKIHPALTYTYRVSAFNQCGNSDFSPICIVGENKPTRPMRLRVTRIEHTQPWAFVTLVWQDRSDNESGFTIQRRLVGERQWQNIGKVGENVETFVDHGAFPDTLYEYRVRANGRLNECIPNSSWSPRLTVDTTQTFGGP
jgi:hypothetical protein